MAKLIASLIAFLVVATLLAIIVARIWHRLGRRRREAFIDSYPYGKFLDQRLSAQRPELSPEQREQVFDGLRDYFHLCNTAGQRMVAMPSQAVDDAWHEFILFTRQYEQFCRNVFGRWLLRQPYRLWRGLLRRFRRRRWGWRQRRWLRRRLDLVSRQQAYL